MKFPTLALLAGQAVSATTLCARAGPQAFASSSDGKYKLSAFDAPVSGGGNPNGLDTWKLSIDDTASGHKQTIQGFGAAVTDATVTVFNQLPAATRSQLLRQLMTADGVNFSLLRHTVGASDLSGDPAYTYDDNGGNADPSFAGFNLGDRGNAMAALLRDMKALRPDATILGTPWGPPAWMQVDRKLVGSTTNNQLDHAYAAQFGQYFVKYLQAYQKAGVRIDAITIQNEPLNNNGGMPSLVIQADESAGLIHDNVGPALRGAGFDTQIWAWDHNTDVASYPQTVLNGASQYVSAVAWHCYANPLNWTVLTAFHQANPGVAQYMTECWTSPSTPWNQAAGFTMGPLQNWASGAIAWTLGTDTNYGPHLSGAGACTTCRGLVTVDAGRGTYSFQVDYYMLGQFSKFIPKGATVLSGSGSWTYADGTGLESVATVNPDGSRTVVIENKFGNDIYVTLTTKSGQTWSGRVYKNSVVTWLLPAA